MGFEFLSDRRTIGQTEEYVYLFLKLFQGESKSDIRTYMRSNQINVKHADDLHMKELIQFCQGALDKN